jgi:hypothetical protein
VLGVLVGAIGLVVEQGLASARGLFPLASLYLQDAIEPLYAAARPGGPASEPVGAARLVQTAVAAGFAAACLALARPTRGLIPLLGAASAAGMLGIAASAAAAASALGSGAPAETGVLSALHSVPPWALAQLVGVVLVAGVLASEERVLPLDELSPGRRRLLWIGAPALALGLVLQPLLAGPWGAWIAAT